MRITLSVNGRLVEADVPPRTSLADLLRERLLLTGTHLGCEHGICGACTVEIDGEIARSCITYAVVLDGARVRTIEGFDDDPLMSRLRRAFTEAHALQCGYCTPGMLIAARDLVRRKTGLSRPQIRHEMSGNLCRCTGYMGVVDAIERVSRGQTPGERASEPTIAGRQGADPVQAGWLGPAPGPAASTRAGVEQSQPQRQIAASGDVVRPAPQPQTAREPVPVATGAVEETDGAIRLLQSFLLQHPRDIVWALMSDPEAVALCMPGARLDGPPQDGRITGRIEVKLGPIVASFAGTGTVEQFPAQHRQRIEGHGADRRSGSRVSGSVDYRLSACHRSSDRETTQVDVIICYALTGLLAQLGRSGLVRDLAQRVGEAFAQNLDARLRMPAGAATPEPARLRPFVLLMAAIRVRLRVLLGVR